MTRSLLRSRTGGGVGSLVRSALCVGLAIVVPPRVAVARSLGGAADAAFLANAHPAATFQHIRLLASKTGSRQQDGSRKGNNDDDGRRKGGGGGGGQEAAVAVPRPIVGYHTDDEGHWVARLSCGHTQHVRHDPPMVERPWVLTEDGRESFLGYQLMCKKCAEGAPKDFSLQ